MGWFNRDASLHFEIKQKKAQSNNISFLAITGKRQKLQICRKTAFKII